MGIINENQYIQLKAKFRNEPMTVRELITLSDFMENRQPPFDPESRTKKLRRDIEKICKYSEDTLNISQFKENKKFMFKPEHQGLVLALIQSGLLETPKAPIGVRKTKERIENFEKLTKTLLDSVELDKLKRSYEYIGAHQEIAMWDELGKQIALLLQTLHRMEVPMKYQNMQTAVSQMEGLRNSLVSEVQQLDAGQNSISRLDSKNNEPHSTSLTNLRRRLILMLAEEEGITITNQLTKKELELVVYISDTLFGLDSQDDEYETLYNAYLRAKEKVEDREMTEMLQKVAEALNVNPKECFTVDADTHLSKEAYWYFTFEKIVKGNRASKLIDDKQKDLIMRVIDRCIYNNFTSMPYYLDYDSDNYRFENL